MTDVTFVFPNLSSLRQRDGPSTRIGLARVLGFEYLEVPADFIKNRTGVERTGLELGSPPYRHRGAPGRGDRAVGLPDDDAESTGGQGYLERNAIASSAPSGSRPTR